jgi:hypothetical protein
MKPKIYIESSVVSYLIAKPTRDLVSAAHQQLTREWCDKSLKKFDVYVSTLILSEISRGDKDASVERNRVIANIPVLSVNMDALDLASQILAKSGLPKKAGDDATHIACATLSGMDFLLTWNCKHIANATIRKKVEMIISDAGFVCPVIATPEELMGEIYGSK